MRNKKDVWGLASVGLTILAAIVQVVSGIVDDKTLDQKIDEIVEDKLSSKIDETES